MGTQLDSQQAVNSMQTAKPNPTFVRRLHCFVLGDPPAAIGQGRVLVVTSYVRRLLQFLISVMACVLVPPAVLGWFWALRQLTAGVPILDTLGVALFALGMLAAPVLIVGCFLGTWKLLDDMTRPA